MNLLRRNKNRVAGEPSRGGKGGNRDTRWAKPNPANAQPAPIKVCVWADPSQSDGVCGSPKIGEYQGSPLCDAHLLLASRRGSVPKAQPKVVEQKPVMVNGRPAPAPKPPRVIASRPRDNGGQYKFGVPVILVIFSHWILYTVPLLLVGVVYILLTNSDSRDLVIGYPIPSLVVLVIVVGGFWFRLVFERGKSLVFDTKKNVVTYRFLERSWFPFTQQEEMNPRVEEIQDFQLHFGFPALLFGIGRVTFVKMGKDEGNDDIVFHITDPKKFKRLYFAWTRENLPEEDLNQLYAKWKESRGVVVLIIHLVFRLFQGASRGLSKLGSMRFRGHVVSEEVDEELVVTQTTDPDLPVEIRPLVQKVYRGNKNPPTRTAGQNFVHCSVTGCKDFVGGGMSRRIPVIFVQIDVGNGTVEEKVFYFHDPENEITEIMRFWRDRDDEALKQKLGLGNVVFMNRV